MPLQPVSKEELPLQEGKDECREVEGLNIEKRVDVLLYRLFSFVKQE